MICNKCKSNIEIDIKNFYIINGIGFFKCKKCNKLNKDTRMNMRTLENVYWR